MNIKRFLILIVLIFGLSIVTFIGSDAEMLFYEGTFNANGNCAYYGSFPNFDDAVYMCVNGDTDHIYGLLFNDDHTELILQSGTVVFRFTNNYWITTRQYSCWSELGISASSLNTISLSTSTFDLLPPAEDGYYTSVSPLLSWAFGDNFELYSYAELETVLTDVNIFEFIPLLFTPRILLTIVFYSGFTLICSLILGFVPLIFLFVWKFLFTGFFGKRKWWSLK